MYKRPAWVLTLFLTAILLTACGGTPAATNPTAPGASPARGGKLTVYSARKEELMKPLVDAFEAKTGIDVTLKSGKASDLAGTIQQEKSKPLGDVYFTTDAATAENLRQAGLLEPYKSPNAEKVPAEFKAADGAWTGVIGRSRNIIYNKDLVKPEDVPDSIYDLTDSKYKNKVAIASIQEGSVQLWLAWLFSTKGEAATVKYVNDLKANGIKVLAENSDVARAVGSGETPIGITNHYYYVFQQRDGKPVGLVYPDQGENEQGTLVIPLAVSIIKGAAHANEARQFVDFALGEGQLILTKQESEFPLTPGVGLGEAQAPGVLPIDKIKRPTVDFKQLGELEEQVVDKLGPQLTPGE